MPGVYTAKPGTGGGEMKEGDKCIHNIPYSHCRFCDTREKELERELSNLLDKIAAYDKECDKRTHWHSADMGGKHGGTMQIYQGKRGADWHIARDDYGKAVARCRELLPAPPSAEQGG